MHNVPKKHRDVAHAWVDGSEIQCCSDGTVWIDDPDPRWWPEREYRIKPRKVRKWRWVAERGGKLAVSAGYFANADELGRVTGYIAIQRIDSTMIEVEE